MAKQIIFLTFEQVLAIHHTEIENFGGSHGIRDIALLESALQRPQASFMGEDLYLTIFDKAAALAHSIISNHTFLDGNKRTGMVAAAGFLHFNGFDLKVEQDDLWKMAVKIATKKVDIEQISKWLKEHSVKSSF